MCSMSTPPGFIIYATVCIAAHQQDLPICVRVSADVVFAPWHSSITALKFADATAPMQ